MNSLLRGSLLALVVMVMLAGCGGGAPAASTSGGSAADAARQFFTAMMTGEGDLAAMLCSTVDESVRSGITQAGDAIKSTYDQLGATLDLTGLTFTVQNESGNNAEVVIAGNLKVNVNGAVNEAPFPSTTYKMLNENGWKVCG